MKPRHPALLHLSAQPAERSDPRLTQAGAHDDVLDPPRAAMAVEPVGALPLADAAISAGPAEKPTILIEIDPVVLGRYARNHFDIVIQGTVVSPVVIAEIRLEIGQQINGRACFSRSERAAVGSLPDGLQRAQRAFQFNISRPSGGRPDECNIQIIATTEDDYEAAEAFVVRLDRAAPNPVMVVSGPTRPTTMLGNARPSAIMYIESGTIDHLGNLDIQGWAVALDRILAVQIYAGEQRISTARLGEAREDVARTHAAYPNAHLSGFSLAVRINEADLRTAVLRAQVICSNGFTHEELIPLARFERRHASLAMPAPPAVIADAPASAAAMVPKQDFPLMDAPPVYQIGAGPGTGNVPVPESRAPRPTAAALRTERDRPAVRDQPTGKIRMFCDSAELRDDGMLFVKGWAVCAAGIAQVRVQLDDRDVGLAVFGYERSDVGSIYVNVPTAHLSGFRFEHRVEERCKGEHIVRVIVRNARNEEEDERLSVVATQVSARAVVPAPAVAALASDPDPSAEFRLELDAPALTNGVMVEPVTGRLTIEGWLLSRSGIASFEVFLDDQRLGDVHYGLARQDVGAAFPDWPNSLRSGFGFHCPPRSLRDGEHTVQLTIRSNSGREMIRRFNVTVKKSEDLQDAAGLRRRVPRVEADLLSDLLADLNYRPAYEFILRQGRSIHIDRVIATLEALRLQAYADWSVRVLAEGDDVASAMRIMIEDLVPDLTDRFTIICPSDTKNWNAPLAHVDLGDSRLFIHLLAGDEIGADALLEFAVAGGMNRQASMLYGDEVRLSPVSKEKEAFFKPNFSPDLLLSTNYIGRPWAASAALLAKTGVTPRSLFADGEYDLVLRCAELATGVHHIPKLLCQRTAAELDDPPREQAALRKTLLRRGVDGEVLASPIPGTWRVRRALPLRGKVSIIIPTCAAHGYIETCIQSLRAKTAYPAYEIVCIDNIPDEQPTWKAWLRRNADKVVDIPDAFNWSVFNNRAAEVAEGDYLLFLNDDIEIVREDWLNAMMEHAQRPEVGITGPQLLYPGGKVQHAGMFLANNGLGRHAFRFASHDDPCYFGLALTQRNVMAVTGACMLVRRQTFERLGRFDEAHQIVNNDLDFCLRAHRAGLLTVFTPYASLIHHELASRAQMKDVFDLTHFNTAWKTLFAAGDPYFNPRLSRHADDYRPDDEPVQWVASGAPLFHVAEIKRILVVKLDHIGDFVTALPPIRRLKKLFPHAVITVLSSRASRAFASIEPSISEFIPFDFFHARSQLGERQLIQDDFIALSEQLRPYRFDLAVDLRKHLSTREVLKYSGARFLAGFDYLGQFPFLDIALDWDGDRTLQRKRNHIIDDLMALVNAIGRATETDRLPMQPPPASMPLAEMPCDVRRLFTKPVVAIHPGAGNITKQWPTEHFSALMDLLIERNDVNVLLVGGPDEVEVANSLLNNVLHPEAVASMAGKTALADLPRLLATCALYVGNDSGPKHIAAAVGVPTLGVHSGVVDPVEWGPMGPRAVALRRNMTCSPCYLANAEDCPRALACLRFLEPSLVYEAAAMLLKPPVSRIGEDPDAEAIQQAIADAPAPLRKPRGRAKRHQHAEQQA